MLSPPRSLEEAQKLTYGAEAKPYRPNRCAWSVSHKAGFNKPRSVEQCDQRNGRGVGGLYCGLHSRAVKHKMEGEGT